MKVTFVAAPLVSKGGVYHSTLELVQEARSRGLEWTAVILMRNAADCEANIDGVKIQHFPYRGILGIAKIRKLLKTDDLTSESNVLISMIPQSDLAIATIRQRKRIAFVRGLPWPQTGETPRWKKEVWKIIELRALASCDEIWATTEILRSSIPFEDVIIIPAGIANPVPRRDHGGRKVLKAVWAARFSSDKNPKLFLESLKETNIIGEMFGAGEMKAAIQASAPSNVNIKPWTAQSEIWEGADVYLGTSFREAFGRSAVEAATLGIPVILSSAFGAAPLLFTDEALKKIFVLDPADIPAWNKAVKMLIDSPTLRKHVSEHVKKNAENLTIKSSVTAIDTRLRSV